MSSYKVAIDFWMNRKDYPNYPHTDKRRQIDLKFILDNIFNCQSVLDLGCGDGAILCALKNLTNIKKFYGYDISLGLLKNLAANWGRSDNLKIKHINFLDIKKLPSVDLTLCLGIFPYIFEDEALINLLKKINTDILIVRSPCTLKQEDEIINTYSKELASNYAAIYRTVEKCYEILSHEFNIVKNIRAYPDEIESKYGTKHFYFLCKKKLSL